MDLHEWAKTLGAMGTTASAIIAVITYVKTTRKNELIQETEAAQRIRDRLHRISAETQKLQRELHDGTSLISACASIANEIEGRMPPVITKAEFEEILSNQPLMLSTSITGWYQSRAGTEINDRLAQLELEALQLEGGMQVLTEIIDLLSRLINQGCSPFVLCNILEMTKLEELNFNAHSNGQEPKKLIDQIKVIFQTVSAKYYTAQHDKAVLTIKNFIEVLVAALCELPNERLVLLSKTISQRRVLAASRTDGVRQRLRDLDMFISKDDKNTLNDLLNNITTYISKESALEGLKNS